MEELKMELKGYCVDFGVDDIVAMCEPQELTVQVRKSPLQ